jgi:RHS repeat-associated protein
VAQETAAGYDREEPLKFTGHERDYAGGFGGEDGHAVDYMHARYSSPTWGRFLSVDPLLGDAHDPQSWNRYASVGNSPINRTDPTGRLTTEVTYTSNAFDETFTSFADDQNGGGAGEGQPEPKPREVKPEPAGGPPVPVPGAEDAGWKWNPNPENKRGGSWGPKKPVKGQSQPSGSWEGGATVPHWDVDDGRGGRRRYDENGNSVSPEAAHGKPSSRTSTPSIRPLSWGDVVVATGLVFFGAAITVMTGGAARMQPATGFIIFHRAPAVHDPNDKCPYCI